MRWVKNVTYANVKIWLADAVLVAHSLLALCIVCGLVVIWLGAALRWGWVRNRPLRIAHLLAIALVSLLSLFGIACPLTVLEDWLRNGSPEPQGFIQRWVSRLLYYDLPAWVFTLAYVVFALMVLLTWRLVPPDRARRSTAHRR